MVTATTNEGADAQESNLDSRVVRRDDDVAKLQSLVTDATGEGGSLRLHEGVGGVVRVGADQDQERHADELATSAEVSGDVRVLPIRIPKQACAWVESPGRWLLACVLRLGALISVYLFG